MVKKLDVTDCYMVEQTKLSKRICLVRCTQITKYHFLSSQDCHLLHKHLQTLRIGVYTVLTFNK